MTVKSSDLRRDLFGLLDRCITSGEPIIVPRRDGAVRIAPVHRRLRVRDLPARPGVLVDAETLDSFSPAVWSPDAVS